MTWPYLIVADGIFNGQLTVRLVFRGHQAFHTEKKSALLTEPAHLLLVDVADIACPQHPLGTGLPAEGTAEDSRGLGLLHMLRQAHSTEEVSAVGAHCLLQMLLADGADALFPAVLRKGTMALPHTASLLSIGPPSPLGL